MTTVVDEDFQNPHNPDHTHTPPGITLSIPNISTGLPVPTLTGTSTDPQPVSEFSTEPDASTTAAAVSADTSSSSDDPGSTTSTLVTTSPDTFSSASTDPDSSSAASLTPTVSTSLSQTQAPTSTFISSSSSSGVSPNTAANASASSGHVSAGAIAGGIIGGLLGLLLLLGVLLWFLRTRRRRKVAPSSEFLSGAWSKPVHSRDINDAEPPPPFTHGAWTGTIAEKVRQSEELRSQWGGPNDPELGHHSYGPRYDVEEPGDIPVMSPATERSARSERSFLIM